MQVNLSTYAFLFSEIVQYSHGRVTSLSQLHEKLVPFSNYRLTVVLTYIKDQVGTR